MVRDEVTRQRQLAQTGASSFEFGVSLLEPLEAELRDHLIGRPDFVSHLRNAMACDEAYHVVHTRGDRRRWGYTKSGVTTSNMAYVWAEDEDALALFQPLADALLPTLQQTTPHDLMLFAASFIIHAPDGVAEASAIPHHDWDLSMPRGSSFSVLAPLQPFHPHIGGLEYWALPFDRFEPPTACKYEHGEAVAFDGAVMHRTQPYSCAPELFPTVAGQPLRVLVQMSLAVRADVASHPRLWGGIQASLERQSTGFYRSPDGPCRRQEEAASPTESPPS